MSERPPERVVIRGVKPELECGRFAVKRAVGETVLVEADMYADGYDAIAVEPIRARFSSWYEMFPRSCGRFKDCENVLPEIAEMGFDVVYFPPIHPIGETHRKGKNNSTQARPGEPGSPWAIGGTAGGHK